MNHPLIIAMDFKEKTEADTFLEKFAEEKLFLKIGMELFYREGPDLIHTWKESGHSIFLDLKLHDIPNTVKSAARQLAALDVDLTTVHAAGGMRMMEAALEGLDAGTPAGRAVPSCAAVTQLTSTSESVMNKEIGIPGTLEESVLHYARGAAEAGMQHVISSAWEAGSIKQQIPGMKAVTPGIRLTEDAADDQNRVVTPARAREYGSDAIVVGRSITLAEEPLPKYRTMMKQWRDH
ncbi:orotidine-5'-phosphate decarboxylase [Salibacterium halotolerans]|uniref:Orotidine 5'-phosphate decarboxylase n=1 Tax=Salibacterium halotolerans TaxID=1884432 RepID=A0A1I5M7Y6_9BACI|nr:orotidine-5'-phosphate decarboxylase [Salibacterium halotolerans]SFP05603.1 orotidine-5'-phosphate decarboxylase [Salibacterium halotolerans]